ncbi:MAG: hypothetical protein FWD64_11895, partial [Acidobacteriaceae bacterium]|nr:hypothetical protein [Acidobacteriaceae bacterium]
LANCAYYVGRFVTHAPEPYKSQMTPTAKYCYRKFHGKEDGYDQMIAVAAANLNPPADFKITPAPSPADIANQVVASTPDLSTLAISDKEFILQHGKPEDAAKVWDTVKGKSVQIPDAIVIAVTDTSIQVAVSEDAVQSKTADFTFVLTPPDTSEQPKGKTAAKTPPPPPVVGDKITLTGTYASFTPDPFMITMSDGAIVVPEAPKKPVARRPAAGHRTH